MIARGHDHRPPRRRGIDETQHDIVSFYPGSRKSDLHRGPGGSIIHPVDVGTVEDHLDLHTGAGVQLGEGVDQAGALASDRILVPRGLRDVVAVDQQQCAGRTNEVIDRLDAVVGDARRQAHGNAIGARDALRLAWWRRGSP